MTVSAITPEGMQLSIPEADNAINRVESLNGTQLFITLPTGALSGDVLRFTLIDPAGLPITVSPIILISSQISAGTVATTLSLSQIFNDGTYSTSVALFRSNVQQGQAVSMGFEVDRTAPNRANITAYYTSVRGHIRSDSTTEDTTPGFFVGVGRPNNEVFTFYVDNVITPATYDRELGTLTPDTPLAVGGPYTVRAISTDPAGNESATGTSFSLTIVSPGMTDLTKVIKGVDVDGTDFVFDGVAKKIYVSTTPTSSVGLAIAQNRLDNVDSGTTTALDAASFGWFNRTITGSTAFTFTGGSTAGKVTSFVLAVTNGGTNVTWPAGVTWESGSAPTLKASGTDYIRFYSSNGTTWVGVLGL